jgi:hypothetical protein
MKQSLKFSLNAKFSTRLDAPQTTLLQGVSRSAIRGGRTGEPFSGIEAKGEGERGPRHIMMEWQKTRTLETRKGATPDDSVAFLERSKNRLHDQLMDAGS